jgi:hypothetical protein
LNPTGIFAIKRSSNPVFACILSLCAVSVPTTFAAGQLDVWHSLETSETLDVFLKDKPVGTMLHCVRVSDGAKTVTVSTSMSVGNAEENRDAANAVTVTELRTYDCFGKLAGAHQDMSGPSGKNSWDLVKVGGVWNLSVTAGGLTTARAVGTVKDDLLPSRDLYLSVKNRTCRKGYAWNDTTLEMVSGRSVATWYTCTAADSARNLWTFDVKDDISGKDQQWQIDGDGKTVLQELQGVFVARKRRTAAPDKKEKAEWADLADIFRVPKEKKAQKGEAVAVTLEGGLSMDESVRSLYVQTGGKWLLSNNTGRCGTGSSAAPDTLFAKWTRPTATIQSEYPEIKKIASSLAMPGDTPCDRIKACNRYVFTLLKKRNTPTFSSAVETLKAGFGDCGEHAVLLAALLRALGIPAAVVIGLVYYDPKKAYVGHAWVMAYAGSWLFADPAFGLFPVDRDRIPLIVDDSGGNAVSLVKYIDRISIEYQKMPTGSPLKRGN